MSIRLETAGNRFYVPCVLRGRRDHSLLALVDTGSAVTAVRGDICRDIGLPYAGTYAATCVHGSHAKMKMNMYSGALVIGDNTFHIMAHEIGRIEEGGHAIDALLGRNILEGYRATLDWPRMAGVLGV